MDTHDNTEEIWKKIPGFSGVYEVSIRGRVRSFKCGGERLLKPSVSGSRRGRYPHVILCQDGVRTSRTIHVLVLTAFVGSRPCGYVSRHLNDVKTDNRLKNLRWGSTKENRADAKRNNRYPVGIQNASANLTDEEVREIRLRLRQGEHQTKLAAVFGVNQTTISRIHRRVTWMHIVDESTGD